MLADFILILELFGSQKLQLVHLFPFSFFQNIICLGRGAGVPLYSFRNFCISCSFHYEKSSNIID
jgi:hypothetical protein